MDPLVRFLPSGRTVRVTPGTNLLEAARAVGLPIAEACRGDGLCGRCAIRILRGGEGLQEPSASETQAKQRNRVAQVMRLACQAVPTSDIEVTTDYW